MAENFSVVPMPQMSTPKNKTAAADVNTDANVDCNGSTMTASPPHTPDREIPGRSAEPTGEELLAMLPPKQADIVNTFLKHGVEPPSCTPLTFFLVTTEC